ncbi:MAG: sulfite exporter TauE/SafE family protein [Bdellovibrionales bacterium]|nr:sulfite exporter TauE/SafE family protein [Bdellovibrionales bacterium]
MDAVPVATTLSWVYFPTAFVLGALHALEPGHAKTLTAAYLIGIKGTRRDAFLLGISVAITHSAVVIGIAVAAFLIGRESFTQEVTHTLQLASGWIVVALGTWLLFKRYKFAQEAKKAGLSSAGLEEEHEHEDECADHHHEIPDYVERGERPTFFQIISFGAAGGLIPCPSSITVMLLALSVGQVGMGLFSLLGFSLGLAVTLVGVGLLVVTGLTQLKKTSRLNWISANSPMISALLVLLSGVLALVTLH